MPETIKAKIEKLGKLIKLDTTPENVKDGMKKAIEKLEGELRERVKKKLAVHAYPREVEFVEKLPKTRSGKIMRRLLKAKELGLPIGDTSTLEEY